MSDKLSVIKNSLQEIRPEFDKLNLNGLSFFKEVEFACQILSKNDYLAGANQQSILNSVKNVAMTGLSLNPVLRYCYLIPRMEKVNGNKTLCCLAEPSYIGLCKILTDTGSVLAISATIVYEKEANSLEIQEGAGGFARHKPYIGRDKPGDPIACYVKAILPNRLEFVGLLRPWEWEDIMKRSESVKSYYAKQQKGEYAAIPTWISDKNEMIRKTAIKNIYKYLPKTQRAEEIGNVIDLDNQANGIDFEEQNKQQYQTEPPIDTPHIEMISSEQEEKLTELLKEADRLSLPDAPFKLFGGKTLVAVATVKINERLEAGMTAEDADKFISLIESDIAAYKAEHPEAGQQVAEESTEPETEEEEGDI